MPKFLEEKKKKYPEGIVTNIYPSMCPDAENFKHRICIKFIMGNPCSVTQRVESENCGTDDLIYKTEIDTDVENKSMDTKGKGRWHELGDQDIYTIIFIYTIDSMYKINN